jgi:predicted MFS family arabinose efflux permease
VASLAGPLGVARLRALAAAGALYGVATGTLTVALTAAAAGYGDRAGVGLLVAVWGIGSLAGGLAYGTARWRGPVERRAVSALAAFAAALALLCLAGSFAALAALMLVLGIPLSPWLGALSACVERAAPDDMAAESFTWTFAAVTVGAACGNALGGVLAQAAGSRAAFLGASAAAFAGTALAARRRGSPRDRGARR